MLQHYFKTAWRSLLRGRSFSVINIAGLAIGMAGAILILLWVQNEISWDQFHPNKDRLYQVYGLTAAQAGPQQAIDQTSQPLAPALQQAYPEVAAVSRVKEHHGFLLTAGDKSFTGINGAFVDPAFLHLFNFPLVQGNAQAQLANAQSITITQSLARRLFGTTDALGKIIKIDSADNFTVTGVLQDFPSNTRFNVDYLLPWAYLKKLGQGWENNEWLSNNTYTYVLLRPGTNAVAFNGKIKNFTRTNTGHAEVWTHFIFPLSKWHLYTAFENGVPVGGRIDTLRVFGIIAAFILLIACINFMNLSTARSEKRAKEVGIRKVAGAGKGLLIGQFITEAFITTCIAAVAAALLVWQSLPLFNRLVGRSLIIPYNNVFFWMGVVAFIVLTSLLAGSYPAFYLSSFKPVSIFKKQFKKTQAVLSPRKILVVVQFSFAVILIVCTLVVHNQVKYAQDRDSGYSRSNLLNINFAGEIENRYSLIKQELLQSGAAVAVTKTMTDITQGGARSWGLRWQNEMPRDTNTAITLYSAEADLVKTTGLHLVAGRDINVHQYPTDSLALLLNETSVKLMSFKQPLGQILYSPFSHKKWHVVGVVKDYVTGSPYDQVPPVVIEGPAAWFNTLHIKLNPQQATAKSLAQAEMIFKKYNPAYPFDYRFVDETYAQQFSDEQRIKTLAGLFAALSVFISCLGLFGLSAYVAESRVKEIGVRKVLGASVLGITQLLSAGFVKLVVVAIVIATPVSWWLMHQWLQDFSYKITLGWQVFAGAGVLAIVIALVTVSFQSVRAAVINPVKSLRTE